MNTSGGSHTEFTLTPTVVATATLASLGGFLFGLDIGYIGPIGSSQGFLDAVNGGSVLTGVIRGWITGIFSIGAVTTAFPLVADCLNDNFGRRMCIICGAVLFCMGAVLQVTAFSISQILAGRFIAGCSVGCLSCTVPLYQSEVAPKEWRGTLGATYPWSITFGVLVAYVIEAIVDLEDKDGWRIAISVQLVSGLLLLVGMIYAPRSPRWLVLQGEERAAEEELHRICHAEHRAQSELQEIKEDVQRIKLLPKPTFLGIFESSYSSKLVLTGMIVQMSQQLVGINVFLYYGIVIFEMLGISVNVTNVVVGSVAFLATLPGLLALDVAGRRSLLFFSSIGTFIACIACALLGLWCHDSLFSGDANLQSSLATFGIPSAICLHVACFAFGWGPVPWVYCAEIFPLEYRSMAVGCTTCTNWVGNFLIAFCTPILLDKLQFHTFFIFGAFCAAAILVSMWLPETRLVSLEDMSKIFSQKFGEKPEKNSLRLVGAHTTNTNYASTD